MGGLGGGGGDDSLPSLTPQWMRGAGGGGGKGASLTGGASAAGSHKAADALPQLPPQLVRSGTTLQQSVTCTSCCQAAPL